MRQQWLKTVGGEVVNLSLILFLEAAAFTSIDDKFVGRVQAIAPGGKCFTLMLDTFETLENAQEAGERFIAALHL